MSQSLAGQQLPTPPLPPGTSLENLPEASHMPRAMKQHLSALWRAAAQGGQHHEAPGKEALNSGLWPGPS